MRKPLQLLVSFLLMMVFVFSACQPARSPSGGKLTIFAASSLTDAFNDLSSAFKADRPGLEIVLNYAGSSQLATQINEGGAADIFAPASQTALQMVSDGGHIDGSPVVFATNRLTIITPADNRAHIAALKDLAKPGIKLVLAVKGVPIRDYADQVFAKAAADTSFGADFPTQVHANLVSEEDNVRQVVSKVALGEADAGIVYVTDITPEMAAKLHTIDLPTDLNVVATYPMVRVAGSPQPELAQAWIDFVVSPAGQAVLARWGFGAAPQK